MIVGKTLLRGIMQTDHVARAHGDGILARLRFGEQGTRFRLRAGRPSAAVRVEAEDVVGAARDDVHGRGRSGRFFQAGVDTQQLPQPDHVFVVVILLEDAFVVRAVLAPEVAAATGFGGRDEVADLVAGEAGGVELRGEGDRLREVEGDGDDGHAEAGENEGRYVAWVVGGLGVAEDGAVGVADEDDFAECVA